MTDADRIKEAIEKITGVPFEPTYRQKMTLAEGHTIEEVIASLPAQFEDARREVAEGIAVSMGWPKSRWQELVDDVRPEMVTDLLVTNRAVPGFSSNSETFMSQHLTSGEAAQVGYDQAMDEVGACHWIFALFLAIAGRLPKPAAIYYWIGEVLRGAEDRTPQQQAAHEASVRQHLMRDLKANHSK